MKGSVVRKGSAYYIVTDGDRGSDGRRRRKWTPAGHTRRDAEAKLLEVLNAAAQGLPVEPSRLSVAAYLESWLSDVVARRNRPRTAEAYGAIVRRYLDPLLGPLPLQKLQPGHVDKVLAALRARGLSENTARHVYATLSKALKDALRRGLVARNPCQAVEAPRVGAYAVDLPDGAAIAMVLAAAHDTPYGPLFRFMFHTGLRRGEALAVRWANVDLERGVMAVVESVQRLQGKGLVFQPPKSSAGRRGIALDATTVALLRGHRARQAAYRLQLGGAYQDQGLVFAGPLGGPLDPSAATRAWEKVAGAAGHTGLRLHDLRHAHAAGLIRAGAHPRVVQERLGHASAAFTMQVYGHVAAGLQAEAAQAFDRLQGGR